jgi:asparagine synthase (glutamine-hydrolysing)
MGYGAYNWATRLKNPIYWNLRFPISSTLKLSSSNHKKRAANVFNCPSTNWKSHIFSQEQNLFSELEINQLLLKPNNSLIINQVNNIPELKRKLTNSEEQAFFDLNNYLVDDLLVKVDRASMFSSLEARVPLLDHNIIEFALNINPIYKINKGTQKHILKEILYDYVPKAIMDRPKWGFSIPLEKWLKRDLNYLIDKYLNEELIIEMGVLNYNIVHNLKKRFLKGENYLYNRIWGLILLNKFLLKNQK